MPPTRSLLHDFALATAPAAGIGAATGAATADEGNRLQGALQGGAIGSALAWPAGITGLVGGGVAGSALRAIKKRLGVAVKRPPPGLPIPPEVGQGMNAGLGAGYLGGAATGGWAGGKLTPKRDGDGDSKVNEDKTAGHVDAAYYTGIYNALEKLGMAMPPIPAIAKAPLNPARQRAMQTIKKLRGGSHPAQLGAAPTSTNPSLRVMV